MTPELIKVNTEIREKYHSGFERDKKNITEVVIHGTGGGNSVDALTRWMFNSGRSGYYKGVALFHYAIDRNGDIYEIIDPGRWVYHSSSGRHDKRTIGIELINPSSINSSKYTNDQYNFLQLLIFDKLMNDYPINSIVGHGFNKKKYSGSYKNCPGNFEWHRIKTMLDIEDFNYKEFEEAFTEIKRG